MRGRQTVAGALLALNLRAAPLPAQSAAGSDWQARTETIVRQLQAGEWNAAEAGTSAMLDEMVAWIAGGDGAGRTLALLTAFRAVAEAGAGREDDALWHWHLAQQLTPEVAAMNLAPFGPASAVLLGRTPRTRCSAAPPSSAVTRPRALERPRPSYPDALRAAGIHGAVTIDAVIGTDGRPRQPRVLSPEAPPTLILAAAEALRQSRFTPARRGGEAVESCFASTTRFELVEAPRR